MPCMYLCIELTHLLPSKFHHSTSHSNVTVLYSSGMSRSFGRSIVATATAKKLAWLAVVVINVVFVAITILISVGRGPVWQQGYVVLCVIRKC